MARRVRAAAQPEKAGTREHCWVLGDAPQQPTGAESVFPKAARDSPPAVSQRRVGWRRGGLALWVAQTPDRDEPKKALAEAEVAAPQGRAAHSRAAAGISARGVPRIPATARLERFELRA